MKNFEIYFTTQKKENERHPIEGISSVNANNKKEAEKIMRERMKKKLIDRKVIVKKILKIKK